MSGLLNALLKKLSPKNPGAAGPQPELAREDTVVARKSEEAQLRALNDEQLKAQVTGLQERAIIRLLQGLEDQELQLRVVREITDESALKRISRSELSKKIKRVAESKLRGSSSAETEKLRKVAELNGRIQNFLQNPRWTDAHELLREAFDPGLADGAPALRDRLKAEVEEYDRTCREMEELCEQLAPARQLSKGAVAKLRSRWKDLEEKYSFPKNFDMIAQFHRVLAERDAPRAPAAPVPAAAVAPEPAPEPKEDPRAQEQKARKQAERDRRQAAMDGLLADIAEAAKHLGHPKSGARLKQLRDLLDEARRWKSEFPAKLAEAEDRLKELSAKRTEVRTEGEWEKWARTDQAGRLQGDLEKTIVELETASDPELAIRIAADLSERLVTNIREMKELGRFQDQFKTLSERGGRICDQTGLVVLEKLKQLLTEQGAKPNDLTLSGLRPAAFEDAISSRVRELQTLWTRIGFGKTPAGREAEKTFAKLFEQYSRQLNLNLGRLKRVEATALEVKRGILAELKRACTGGPPSALERARVAKGLKTRWEKSAAAGAELQAEFDGTLAQLGVELAKEAEALTALVKALEPRAQAILDKLQAKTGASLTQALKAVLGLDTELGALVKNNQALQEWVEGGAPGFGEACEPVRRLLVEARSLAEGEVAGRIAARESCLREAEALALSEEWVASRSRFEELRQLWKNTGAPGQARDSRIELYFEHLWQFYQGRAESARTGLDAAKRARFVDERHALICSLEALARFVQPETKLGLPAECAGMSGAVLSSGFKFKHILSLDPKGGPLKETRKIMDQWCRLGIPNDESLAGLWTYYLKRLNELLELG